MTKHTPGPWHIAPPGKAQSLWIICQHDGGGVADCEPPGPWMPREEATANAHLIAAAPEMLAALKEISRNSALCDAWLNPVRAAIARAEGSSTTTGE